MSALQYELYYTNDSTFLADSRSNNKYNLSGKTPLCTDIISIKHITKHCSVHSPSSLSRHLAATTPSTSTDPAADATATATQTKDHLALELTKLQDTQPTFIVTQVYDAKPVEGAEFVGELDYDEVYARGVRDKDWDTEAIMEEVSSEEEEVRRKKEKKKEKAGKKKTKGRKVVVDEGEESDDSSADDESADEFVSRAKCAVPHA